MNAARLLAQYEQIADAPDAIDRLRQFILDLAVRGKLVPQDPKDEPASTSVDLVKKEVLKAIQAKIIRQNRNEKPIEDIDLSELPAGWCWSRLSEITRPVPYAIKRGPFGSAIRKDMFVPEGFKVYEQQHAISGDFTKGRYYITKEKFEELSAFELHPDEILVSCSGTVGKVAIVPESIERGIINQALLKLSLHQSALRNEYFLILFPAFFMETETLTDLQGTAQKNIPGMEILKNMPFPLPPLAEQHRIVAKVDELMALCDQLEAARVEREAARDRLAASSLARLNAPDPETFLDDARFVRGVLPVLTTRPDQIKQLRQTILNLAVRGKLVPQDPKDEPASELLKRIANEKARLVKSGKSKRQEALPEVDSDQTPFQLPSAWTWARFPELGIFGRGKSKHRPRNDPGLFDGGTHLLIQTGDVARSKGVIETYTSKYNEVGLSQSYKWPKGTLCITIAANIADSGILTFDACFPDSVVGFVPASMFETARYFEYFVRTAKANLLEFAPATAQKNINLEILMSVLIPLPPLAEQQRIVAKVDAFMALCDQLESSLTGTASTRRRLLDALLAEALEPAVIRELEAVA